MTPEFGLIIVGDEILSGKRQDKHMSRVIDQLKQRGLTLSWCRIVGDDRARITGALREAFASADVVFSCGGIGATPDDHTRQCAAAALGVELALHPEAKSLIEERMRDVAAEQGVPFEPNRPDNLHRYNMGVFPVGAEIIPNPYNKIPGFSCRGPGGGAVHFVPGFPVMAWPMIEWVLDQRYPHLHRTDTWQERSVIVFGAMEAALTPLMESLGLATRSRSSVCPAWTTRCTAATSSWVSRVSQARWRAPTPTCWRGCVATALSLAPKWCALTEPQYGAYCPFLHQ